MTKPKPRHYDSEMEGWFQHECMGYNQGLQDSDAYHDAQMRELLERIKQNICGYAYSKHDIRKFNTMIDDELAKLEQGE